MEHIPVPEELIEEAKIFQHDTPLVKVIPTITKEEGVILTKDNKYFGIVDKRCLVKSLNLVNENQASFKIAKRVPLINSSTSIMHATEYMYLNKSRLLPYERDTIIKGVLKRNTLLRIFLSEHLLSAFKVNDFMTTPVIGIDVNATLAQAKATMKNYNIVTLPVINQDRLVGIITLTDMLVYSSKIPERAPPFRKSDINRAKVSDIMQSNVFTISKNSSIDDAIRSFVEKNISSLPVLEGNRLIGMLTVSDILRGVIKIGRKEHELVMISGLDEETEPYKEDVIKEASDLVNNISQLSGIEPDYVSIDIKHMKGNRFEIKARLYTKKGVITSSYNGFGLLEVLKEALDRVYNMAIKEKSLLISEKKNIGRIYEI